MLLFEDSLTDDVLPGLTGQIAFIYETDPMLVLTRNVEKQLFTVHVVVEVEGKGRINLGYGSGGTEHMAHLAVLDGLMVEAAEHIRANGFNSIGVPIDETAKEWKLRAR